MKGLVGYMKRSMFELDLFNLVECVVFTQWLFVRDQYTEVYFYSYGIKSLLEIYMKFLSLLNFLVIKFP